MGLIGPLLLSFAVWVTGISTPEQTARECDQANLLGAYVPATDTLFMCEENIEASDYSYGTIRRHELVHAIQERMGQFEDPERVIIPEPELTVAVRELMDDKVTVSILLAYPENERHAEFEARLLQNAPDVVIASMLLASHFFN